MKAPCDGGFMIQQAFFCDPVRPRKTAIVSAGRRERRNGSLGNETVRLEVMQCLTEPITSTSTMTVS